MAIQNLVYYETGVLTSSTIGTVLYDAGVTGHADGKGLTDVHIVASEPVVVTYTTIFGVLVEDQDITLTNPISLGAMGVAKIELAQSMTASETIVLYGNEKLT